MCRDYGVTLLLSPLEFCSDNAAMIGRVAIESYQLEEFDTIYSLQTRPELKHFNLKFSFVI